MNENRNPSWTENATSVFAALYAMWLSHIALFWNADLDQLGRILIVVQNIVSSFFNSHLFDFLEGWIYVVGVAGGIPLRNRRLKPSPSRP